MVDHIQDGEKTQVPDLEEQKTPVQVTPVKAAQKSEEKEEKKSEAKDASKSEAKEEKKEESKDNLSSSATAA